MMPHLSALLSATDFLYSFRMHRPFLLHFFLVCYYNGVLLLLHWQHYPSLSFLQLHRLALIYFQHRTCFTMILQHIKVYYVEVTLSLPVWVTFITTLSPPSLTLCGIVSKPSLAQLHTVSFKATVTGSPVPFVLLITLKKVRLLVSVKLK